MFPATMARFRVAPIIFTALPLGAAAEGTAPDPDPATLVAYYRCEATAEARGLTIAEASVCAQLYLLVKLSLLPGVDPEAFAGLDVRERATVNAAAYGAFRDWREANAERVAMLKAASRP